jgi:hypothetical protein
MTTDWSANLSRSMIPEHEVLRCCARVDLGSGERDRLRGSLPLVTSWDHLSCLADYHDLTPLLYRHLGGEFKEQCPPDVLEHWRGACRKNLINAQRLTAELLAIARLFQNERLPFLAFKGPVAGALWYGDVGLRVFSDLDLLIHAVDFPRAKALLGQREFHPHRIVPPSRQLCQMRTRGELIFERAEPPMYVDLHSQLIPPGYSFSLEPETPWEGSEQVPLGGMLVPTLTPETGLIFLCLHGAKHGCSSLKWLVDLAQAIRRRPSLDWDHVLGWARPPGRLRILGLGLRLASGLLEAPVPADVLARAARDSLVNHLAGRVTRGAFPAFTPATTPRIMPWREVYFQAMSRSRDRCWYLATELLLPTAWEWQLVDLPGRLYPLYYILRPLRLLIRAVRGRSGSRV